MDFFGNPNGPGGILGGIGGGFPAGFGPSRRQNPRAYDEYLKAYSMAMLPGRERENVSYGGKIIMPQSALANLTNLDLEVPWMFQLRNPQNPAASTHAGVLEFIAEEGVVHLPYWMMKTLRLNEGDPIRITGTDLPKGKLVKLQAQSIHFLEISDHKAVLEQALRNFTALTQGDIVEISYNSIVFGLLVMETKPGGEGICVLDTDLEVDFAPPVGYVEPERPKAAPPATMASKLKIDLDSHSPGSSRPGSALSGGFAGASAGPSGVSKGGDHWESFKGKGETLSGRKTKGKGISHRKVEDVSEGSKIIRTDQHRIVSNNTYDTDVKVPAALNLPFGQLFFGFNIAAYTPPPQATPSSPTPSSSVCFL
ncbi:ubiquitin fusion degradation protein UFD1-domain-containing protein [Panaeolus papilionaceus]|nr:ubiquitin fusion degradation protein UFD1-domain-containing protein [Panaeolus papilionaceus]